jgi:ornithine cyclodeaminase/alanine dehydrogenase-like protein (mu-crystallin family)
MLIFSLADMMELLTPAEYLGCVDQAYCMHGEGRYYMDPRALSCSTSIPANGRPLRQGLINRERYSRRDRRGHHRSQAGTAVGGRDHALRLSTGIALQDLATVPLEHEPAVAAGVGVENKMTST